MVESDKTDTYIRVVSARDAAALLAVYAPYVKDTAITFEYDVPQTGEFKKRIEDTLRRYPYLAAVKGGRIVGYAYTGVFVGRAAYDHSASISIYIQKDCRGSGLGRRLYEALEAISKAQNITNLYACVGYPQSEDPYLTKNSADFHSHMGYETVGRFHGCGCKFGSWYDMIWMEKTISARGDAPAPFIPFPFLPAGVMSAAGVRTL